MKKVSSNSRSTQLLHTLVAAVFGLEVQVRCPVITEVIYNLASERLSLRLDHQEIYQRRHTLCKKLR